MVGLQGKAGQVRGLRRFQPLSSSPFVKTKQKGSQVLSRDMSQTPGGVMEKPEQRLGTHLYII